MKKVARCCSVSGCDRPHYARALCKLHYERQQHGYAPRPSVDERFWGRMDCSDPAACWLWPGLLDRDGYGYLNYQGHRIKAHRLAWHLVHGPLDRETAVCHACDVRYPLDDTTYRRCCNPAHLFRGTASDNTADMVSKGRQARGDRSSSRLHPDRRPRGSAVGTSTLTEDTVRRIRELYVPGVYGCNRLARQFGVTPRTIQNIVLSLSWKHVNESI